MIINIDRITEKVTISPSPIAFSINVEDNFNPLKKIQIVDGLKQKTNEQGQLLYKVNIQDDGSYYETINDKTVIKTEEKSVVNKWFNDSGIEQSQEITVDEPIEWINNEPIMIDNVVDKLISFSDYPTEFTVVDILKEKYNELLKDTPFDFARVSIFLNENDIDFSDIKANTGMAIMELLPYGYVKSKLLKLDDKVTKFKLLELDCEGVDVFVNDKQFIDKDLTLDQETDEIILTFKNVTDKCVDIKGYAIAY
jgi:hypothetical protein